MISAGLVPYRLSTDLEILIAHPGGPLWERKDAGAWSIVKGRVEGDEDARRAAAREFREETGWPAPSSDWIDLGEITQRSGKLVKAWAVEAPDLDPADLRPGQFQMRWRGRLESFPEIDRVRWVSRSDAMYCLLEAQHPFYDRLAGVVES